MNRLHGVVDNWQTVKRSPLGIMPCWRWLEIRKRELVDVICRHRGVKSYVTTGWVLEWHWLDGLTKTHPRKDER